mmetsp:Transcript_18709/g.26360  ORF Transcript_18709/g.26360 Transcript_18709/m.26360 type:complete len:216 (+) Transcript_18709:164-811(+)
MYHLQALALPLLITVLIIPKYSNAFTIGKSFQSRLLIGQQQKCVYRVPSNNPTLEDSSFGFDGITAKRKSNLSPTAMLFSVNQEVSSVEGVEALEENKVNWKSLTAIRASLRAATGFSLTAMRTTLRGLTGVSVTTTMKVFCGLFPAWFRSFLQPFLILYYTPLMILRSWIGNTKTSISEQRAAHQTIVQGWRDAVAVAEAANEDGYWPVSIDGE